MIDGTVEWENVTKEKAKKILKAQTFILFILFDCKSQQAHKAHQPLDARIPAGSSISRRI